MVYPAYEYVAEPSALGNGDKTASGFADTVIMNGGQRLNFQRQGEALHQAGIRTERNVVSTNAGWHRKQ